MYHVCHVYQSLSAAPGSRVRVMTGATLSVRKRIKETMSESLGKSESSTRIIDQHLPDQVEHVLDIIPPVLLQVVRDVVQQGLAVLPHILTISAVWIPVEATSLEELDPRVLRHPRGNMTQYSLHHRQVLPVLMGLEQCHTERKLINYAANAPNITGLTPAKLKNNFRSAVVTRGDDQTVMLVIKGGRAKVNQTYFRILNNVHTILHLEVRVAEENVFWFEVSVGDSILVEEIDCITQFIRHLSHLSQRIWMILILLEKLINTLPQHLECDAHVSVEIKTVNHLYTSIFASRIVFSNLIQNVDLQLGRLTILLNIFDDLQSDCVVTKLVINLNNFAKCSLSQVCLDLILGL